MEELLRLLAVLRDTLRAQISLFNQLHDILDREEELIARFALAEIEQVIIEKDQIVQRATKAEERRVAALKRICFLVSYDARGKLPSLKEFILVFERYVADVQNLIQAVSANQLQMLLFEFRTIAVEYQDLFGTMAPRIYRNQQILKKVTQNISRSRAIFEMEVDASRQYDPAGRARTKSSTAQLRVKA